MGGDENYSRAPPDPLTAPAFSRPVRRVVVVGGTHGNEYTGVWCIKAIEGQRLAHRAKSARGGHANNAAAVRSEAAAAFDGEGGVNVYERFPTLDISTLLANPAAYMSNKRFVDADLNREFSWERWNTPPSSPLPLEYVRAREVEAILGPKFAPPPSAASDVDGCFPDSRADVVVDLHTTTANMGVSLIVPEGDALMAAAAAHVVHECRREYGADGAQCLIHAQPRRRDRMNLSSCGRHGFTIEVGPTPQGVVRHDCVEKTQFALHSLLGFLNSRNLEIEGGDDAPSAVFDRLRTIYPGGTVPCYRSAPARRPGELSGKIPWPNDPTNPNFPAVMVHRSIQDQDFCPLRVGDPLFVRLDGTVTPYDGSHGEEVRLMFINEGGYYYASSGTGIGVALATHFDWRTGSFAVEEDEEEGTVEDVVAKGKAVQK